MLGAAILLLVMVVVFPPLLFGTGLIVSTILSWLGTSDANARYEGTEYADS